MPDLPAPVTPGPPPPGLGPHCVGRRVVVRRVLPGVRGPSGGPALTDLLGVMTAWEPPTTTVRPETGEPVVIALADVVSGKPVPPRPSVRLRVTAEEAERRANQGWPSPVSEQLGGWLLRAADGFSDRGNSALCAGDPRMPVEAAAARIVAFYSERGLPPLAQVVVGSVGHDGLAGLGWLPARPGQADTLFLVGSVAQLARTLAVSAAASPAQPVVLGGALTDGWLATDERARRREAAARAVLLGPEQVALATVTAGGAVAARGRVSCQEDWAGVTDLWVSPGRRRSGLGRHVLGALVGWAAERGARTAYLQVRGDNEPALAMYASLGLAPHHAYRYLRPA